MISKKTIPARHIFSLPRRPYYIYALPYKRTSAGIKVLHLLCHALNEIGEEAYVTTDITDPRLRTPQLDEFTKLRHQKLKVEPIAVYPEIVHENPLRTNLVVRYIMNIIGLLGGPKEYPQSDIILAYSLDLIQEGMSCLPLFLPTVDVSVFHNKKNLDDKNRNGKLIYSGRFTEALKTHPELLDNSTVITYDWPESHEHLAELMRKSSVLYCFTYSAIALEAMLCGCPVVFMPSPYNKKFFGESELGKGGYTFKNTPEAISRARKTLNQPLKAYEKSQKKFWVDLHNFVEVTQSMPITVIGDKQKLDGIDLNYKKWLEQRSFIETDTKFLNCGPLKFDRPPPFFHLLVRLPEGFESHLADTLDSLGQQIHEGWHLDVISMLPSPEGLDSVPNVSWHTLTSTNEFKTTADTLAKATPCSWVIEIPAGARLDILYLWRLAKEISASPDTCAFFVDDDCCDNSGQRHSPRFKPGINSAYLQSTDLAGPLCVSKETWFASGGAGDCNGSPWFSQLLRITEKFGWQSIKHIPDVLITYLDEFPSDAGACQLALRDAMQNMGTEGEVSAVTAQSWNIRYALNNPPPVTIAILSQGQLELITRCLDSVIKFTQYLQYEILIFTNELAEDPGLDQWLKDIEEGSKSPKIRSIRIESRANHATRCNSAVAASENEFILLLREETVIVQDKWLEELVRIGQQANVAATAPLLHRPGDARILASGKVLGLMGGVESPYGGGKASLGENGYLDYLQVPREASALPSSCLLIRKSAYQEAGGMDDVELGDHLADADLCLKMRRNNKRLIVQPRASVVFGGETNPYDTKQKLKDIVRLKDAQESFHHRWGKAAFVDPFWNPNLSLAESVPTPETEYRTQWQYLPSNKPRILAHPIGNGQGDFRITSPLTAIRQAGLATECVWRQKVENMVRFFNPAELARMAPSTFIIQNYIHDISLMALDEWNLSNCRPFIVYALDDLIDNLDKANQFRMHFPPNVRSRLKYALARCDRLVVSTDFLAESYQHFIKDIRVVPNRLEQAIWYPLISQKRTGERPRIGWAGGSTHQGDLILLKEIIEQTSAEADWVFFGMCPDEIRPFLAEFHDLVSFTEYPKYLASLDLDIAVAPLAQTPFNQGKSNLRLLEYGALGIPVVCTDIDPYRNSPACRVANIPEAWVSALRERIYDPEAREREGRAMHEWVLQNYMLEDHLDEWLSAHLPSQ